MPRDGIDALGALDLGIGVARRSLVRRLLGDQGILEDLKRVGHSPDDGEFLEIVPVALDQALAWIREGKITDPKTIIGLLVVNLFGGIVASIAFVPVTARSELILLFMLLLTIGLVFGGRAANPRDGRIYAGALMVFTIIFGLGVSPIPTTAPESFATRMNMLFVAVTIAACGIGLLWRTNASQPPAPPTQPSPNETSA